jgi:hypothetical protein
MIRSTPPYRRGRATPSDHETTCYRLSSALKAMGQSHSTDEAPRRVSIEELSHEVALRFASKCYTHLEVAHFKDNFKTLADHQDGIEYWKEETLCRFLCLPDEVQAGSVIYQMATYLGAFPFPSLAPCILTREAMLKVITIMTERYSKILKRGKQDKIKLLFRSMAVFDRRMSTIVTSPEKEKLTMEQLVNEQKPDDMVDEEDGMKEIRSHVAGFAIDEPANDEEEEDDDELALAALEALDAIEVFKQDHKVDRKIHHARIPVDNFRKLVMLLLLISPLESQDNLAYYSESMTKHRLHDLRNAANSIIAACEPDEGNGIRYSSFIKAISSSLPYLFDPLSAQFEHFLFSKTLDLSKHRGAAAPSMQNTIPIKVSPILASPPKPNQTAALLTQTRLSHLSTFLSVVPASTGIIPTIFHSKARFHPLYSTTTHGTSLSSFSRQVMSWQAPTILLVSGNTTASSPRPSSSSPRLIILGAFLPTPWDRTSSSTSTDPSALRATLFQLSPRHAVFPANPYNHATPHSHFSSKTGIALGCIIPPTSRATHSSSSTNHLPILGPVSLRIDDDISTAVFQHDPDEGHGAFLPDPNLEASDRTAYPKKIEFDIDTLEVWGVAVPDPSDAAAEDAATKQKKRLAWEEAEAARRRGVNFGGDKEGARALLEMAGLVGDHAGAGGRSGGSV